MNIHNSTPAKTWRRPISYFSEPLVCSPSRYVNGNVLWMFTLQCNAGYVGGAVLNLFLKHPKVDTFAITAPVRSPAKAKLLEQLGVQAPIASLDDYDKLVSLASNADVVLNIVSGILAWEASYDSIE